MFVLAAQPLSVRLLAICLAGMVLGSLVNWAIYRLAWNRREISPWGPTPSGAAARSWADRIPVFGWLRMRREHNLHGPGFWVRPLAIEAALGLGLPRHNAQKVHYLPWSRHGMCDTLAQNGWNL